MDRQTVFMFTLSMKFIKASECIGIIMHAVSLMFIDDHQAGIDR